ncbi:MAG: glycerol-3-phosphate 1-O-acyltransferase PlsY [Lachnospira sp.]|nr:glycerol-3-phosphate 1-O-acyltransferase PlsY [Lachnospira sp.]
MERLFSLAIGYVFGLFQTGYIYGRLHNIDIREHGSGNAGTTNAMRTLGKKAGIITYIGDALKTVLSAVVVHFLFGRDSGDMEFVLILYSGFGAILGHNFPFYLKFKGGKGIAASSGVIMTIFPFNLIIPFLELFTFVIVTAISKYVSLGSLCLMLALFIEFVVFGQLGMINVGEQYLLEVYAIGAAMMVLAFVRHRTNIQRLLSGTERKIGKK